ncbi:S8 family serine peptidase [Methylobacterium sp. NEAU 140]|uniref:S8 family peptidase n=1 Tax=Methylobacterium sp. NEAU 140 TaxID=3064945 RepID=UPI002736E8CF|nr:S8 family serine peptidase [Methylobacterium sp. NEAU 140]MDP4025551.1 S8 family serine peptidase [Methylobacterium sp. NEAU 140]
MSSEETKRRLARQIEMIRDTTEERTFDVIVRMRRPDDEERSLIDTVSSAFNRRRLSISARDFLPQRREIQNARPPRRGRTASRAVQSDRQSLAAEVASAIDPRGRLSTVEGLRSASLAALDPLIQSDAVREAKAAVSATKPNALDPIPFWTSGSAIITVRDEDLARIVEAVPGIEDIYPNRRLFVPPVAVPRKVPEAIEDNKASSWGIRRIAALGAWGAYGCRGDGVLVGLLDTGVDPDHPDLKGKIKHWAEFDATGVEVQGSTAHDSDRHGTHCAGTIVGGDASGRWIGVAPEARLAAALVLDGQRGGTDAQVLAGIDWAVNLGVDVISLSLGAFVLGPATPNTYTRAILSAMRVGIPVVAAIGNEGSQTSGSPGSDYFAFAVGATDQNDLAAGFSGGRTQIIQTSSYFPPEALPLLYSKPDISAPGVAVWSSVPGGGWEHFNGTSMATPHVAGAIALLLSATNIKDEPPGDRAFLIQDLLTGSSEELGEAGQNHRFGFGRLDILRAIGFARDLGYGPSSRPAHAVVGSSPRRHP